MREHMGFLFQDEQLFGNLTVREHLLFQCRFRMGRMAKSECAQRADALITELGLTKCKSTLIGSIGAGISGAKCHAVSRDLQKNSKRTLKESKGN